MWSCDPHTRAKHRVLRRYLQAWFPILLSGWDSVTYAEGFAGPGVYEGGEPGSPVIASRTLFEHEGIRGTGKTVNLVFVEERRDRMDHLRQQIRRELEQHGPSAKVVPRVRFAEGACDEVLPAALAQAGSLGRPVFAFLDSFGGPDIPFTLLERLAGNPSSEVLVTFGTRPF
ncbi:MAG: three-Cys-motif partner protein TcmP [Nocardioidaceae bacterium]